MYYLIELHSCNYLRVIFIVVNVVIDKMKSEQWSRDEMGEVVQSWL